MFDLITQQSLKLEHFCEQTEAVIDGFLIKRMITLIYADGGAGKSWLAMAVARYCASIGMNVVYLDYDNPLNALKERGVPEKLIVPFPNLHYIQRSRATMSASEMLSAMEAQGSYHNTLIIMDSLRNLENINNDNRALQIMEKFMNLRESGATILILSHANKDGRNYQGSNNIRNSLDNMYRLSKGESPRGEINFLLEVDKERAGIQDQAYCLDVGTLHMHQTDIEQARLSADEKYFIEQVQSVLAKQSGLNKKELLESIGCNQDDKTARNRLDRFDGSHWSCTKIKGIFTYQLISA